MIYSILGFLLKLFGYVALICYLGWAAYALYRAVFKAGKNGTLPWL